MSEDILRGETHSKTAHPFLSTGNAYLFLSTEQTEYQGLHIRKGHQMYKVLDAIQFEDPIRRIHAEPTQLHCYTDSNKILITLENDAVTIQPTYPCTVKVDLDCRPQKNHPTFGREYEVQEDADGHTIRYYHNGNHQQTLHLDNDGIEFQQEWIPKKYVYDEKRTGSGEAHVYRLGDIQVDEELRISWDGQSSPYHHRLHQFLYSEGRERLCAGYPWFSESWARDEVIAVEPLIRHGELRRAKEILMSYIGSHTIASVIGGELGSADVYGWLAKRLSQLDNKDPLPSNDCKDIYEYFATYVEKYVDEKGLIPNGPLETWMDTSGNTSDTREGYSVEIQFGLLAVYDLMTKIARRAGKPRLEEKLSRTKGVIRHLLVDKNILHDGYTNGLRTEKRPNVFLAWYLYPRGVHRKTWLETFDNVIDHCWLEWGGLSSIGKTHPLYQPQYTGQDNKSYHRGDSWYYVNNVAAIAMQNVAKHKFMKHIHKIRDASLRDWEDIGAIGACSEVSSAEHQDVAGTFSQAWSLSTLDELLYTLR